MMRQESIFVLSFLRFLQIGRLSLVAMKLSYATGPEIKSTLKRLRSNI